MTAITDDALRGMREHAAAFKAAQDAAPAGPYSVCPNRHDDWGFVRGGDGMPVATTCTQANMEGWERPEFGTPEHRVGPPKVRAVADLLALARNTTLADMAGTLLAEVERHRAALNEVQRLRECADAALARVRELEKELEGG